MGRRRSPIAIALLFAVPFAVASFGLTLFEAAQPRAPEPGATPRSPTEDEAALQLLGLLLALVGGLAYVTALLLWYYRVNQEIVQRTGVGWNVGLWTFLLLVPVANVVSYYKAAQNIHRGQLVDGVPGLDVVPLFLLMFLPVVKFVGLPVAQVQINKMW